MSIQQSCLLERIRAVSYLAALLTLTPPTLVSAQVPVASFDGNILEIPVVTVGSSNFSVKLFIVEGSEPTELELISAEPLVDADTEGASSFDGSTLSIPLLQLGEVSYRADLTLISENPVRFRLAAAEVIGSAPPAVACTRPDPDRSHGLDDPPIISGATIPTGEIFDGGPGPDGIPPLESPVFILDFFQNNIGGDDLVVGVKIGDDVRAYPHYILDWHEVVNDQFSFGRATLSYCPLTGSAMLWKAFMEPGALTFGTSGLLYNSNLILYDRRTFSFWSQMLERAVMGSEVQRIPDRVQVVETTWNTWQAMYPQTSIMAEDPEISRPYGAYPYGSFKEDQSLLFPVNNMNDNRLHRKERVLGINVGFSSKVYPISSFASNVEVINDSVGNMPVVAAGSSGLNFAVVFNRELEDCTVLDFQAVQGNLPIVMRDNEGNEWDVFGHAVSGARTGQQLQKTNSYISYWYAWTAFFEGVEIHQ